MLIETMLVKNELEKLIWKIKLKYQNNEGGYDIPKKYLENLEALKNTIVLINQLNGIIKELQTQLSNERVNYIKSKRQINNLENTITSLENTIKEMSKAITI
jgi:peptidoglycan hydrolase CwlO-like protein